MGLRELVAAWQERAVQCDRTYRSTLESINRELDAVGGYATTSADAHGICMSFRGGADGWTCGVERAGDRYGGTGPLADTVAPHHPEVGDRCLALEQEWRKDATASVEAVYAVRQYILACSGAGARTELEYVALALCRSEEGERLALAQWLRDRARALKQNTVDVIELAGTIERGDHLR